MSENELIERLIKRLSQPAPLPINVQLWEAADIGRYLHRTADSVRRLVVVLPSFPDPVRIPTSDNPRPLWKAREVIAWAERQT